jgi:hypothetical protein
MLTVDGARIVAGALAGSAGRVIDSEAQAGGYPPAVETRQPFNAAEWDLATMESAVAALEPRAVRTTGAGRGGRGSGSGTRSRARSSG